MQRLLVGEVNAAAEGLFEAGVDEVLVNDSHGRGDTIATEDLIPGVRIVHGRARPGLVTGISRRFGALVQVGMHAMAGTPSACLAHSMSRGVRYRINGRDVGEMQMVAYLAGHLGIPWVFTSGDSHACVESEQWVPGIVTAPVKQGVSEFCAIHVAPADARKLIRERIREAISVADGIAPLVLEGLAAMEVTRDDPWPDRIRPDAERVDAYTVRYAADDVWQLLHKVFYENPDLPVPD
jgi:D-amino peptidase